MHQVNQSEGDANAQIASNSLAPAGDESLPPVEPPSAAFLIQLFVVPALIVLVIVGVWLSVNWLIRRTSGDPNHLIDGLEQGPSVARWQRASELADMLRNKRFAEFKRNKEAAANLARILNREIDQATSEDGMEEEDITLRYFLSRALGEFEVQEGIDALLKAAQTQRVPSEKLVRYGALEGIAVRAHGLRQLDPPQTPEHETLMPALEALSVDEDPLVREKTAYALGQIGTPAAIERLEIMVDDPQADTRYNAAVALARYGNARAVETLAEMLDVEELAALRTVDNERAEAGRRAIIVGNALQAVEALAKRNPDADLSLVIESLEQLAAADTQELNDVLVPTRAASEAKRVLESLQGHVAERASE
ncbi:MAG TPA: HEAT repeat domain-containing protein [Lacipirellulaceae bacterium]